MAEPLSNRNDQVLPPEIMADRELDPERELPPSESELPSAGARANPRLNETAEKIGSALGSAARRVNDVRDRLTVIRGGAAGASTTEQLKEKTEQLKETAQQKVQDIRERAATAVEQAKIQATAKIQDARVKASQMAQDAKQSATDRARMAQRYASRLADERPIQVLVSIGGAAFLLGVFLRVWRSNRG